MPEVPGHYPLSIQQQYDDPSSQSLEDPFGVVFDESFNFDDAFQSYEPNVTPSLGGEQEEI